MMMKSIIITTLMTLSCYFRCIQLLSLAALVPAFAFAPSSQTIRTNSNNVGAITTIFTPIQSSQNQYYKSSTRRLSSKTTTTQLYSLKPAALPLMDSGKALARSGELLIDLTSQLNLYGGGLSAAGANIRNCGDCLAQAGASCRMKTAQELVIDELREGSDCLREGTDKLGRAVEESEVDGNVVLRDKIEKMILPMKQTSLFLEEVGASILQKESTGVIASHLISAGEALLLLSMTVQELDEKSEDGKLSAQRMVYASEQMILAGKELKGDMKDDDKPKGKGWIKG
mmetsp:Transcript_16205/g.26517  ORF Transcript_16205/g.26517 Transcript_16205/m.26517 type:complete len:286 (-) Transcript_16205:84-941(-)